MAGALIPRAVVLTFKQTNILRMDKSNDRDRLSRMKAEERARTRRADALRNLVETRSDSLDNKVLAVRTIHHADHSLLASAIGQMMAKDKT